MSHPFFIPALASALAFLSVLALCLGFSGYLRGRQRLSRISDRIAVPRLRPGLGAVETGEARRAVLSGRTWGAALSAFKGLGERIKPKSETDLDKGGLSLTRAGFRGESALVVFWGIKCALAVVMGLSPTAVRFLTPLKTPAPLMAVGITFFALAGFYVPEIWLKFRIAGRRMRILHALPDALDLLVVCVESGMGLDQALSRVGREMRLAGPELSREMKVLNLELRAGKMRREALKNLALRVGLEDMNSLVTMLIQADAFGASVADTLRVYSDALRVRRCRRAEEMAAKLPVKLLFPLVLFILPALFVVILGPAGIQLMRIFAKIQ